MLAQLKKTPIAAALGFIVACSVCLLPALVAATAAGGLVSAGGISGNGLFMGGGLLVLVGSIAASVWLLRRHHDRCTPNLDQ
jgi:hypothetical protein